jgi:LemA protein
MVMTGLSVAIAVVVLLALWAVAIWRGLLAARSAADATWAGIDVHLRARHALVPDVIAAVQAEIGNDELALAQLSAACDRATSAGTPWERAEAERRLVAAIATVAALAERHPDLGASGAFVDLQARLAVIEDQTQAARRIYNADVRLYRTRRGRVPAALLRRLGEFEDRPYFELDHTRERGAATLALAQL